MHRSDNCLSLHNMTKNSTVLRTLGAAVNSVEQREWVVYLLINADSRTKAKTKEIHVFPNPEVRY